MTDEEMVIRDIDGLRLSIRLNGEDLAKKLASVPEVIERVKWCLEELHILLRRLEQEQKGTSEG